MFNSDRIIEADLTWLGDRFEPNVQVVASPDGLIEHVGILGEKPTERLERCALLPGFVNAHSHSFQRGLRGKGETFPTGEGSFWSWRQAMYELVESLGRDELYRISHACFREMLAAGITSVGEFHYLHHGDGLQQFEFDETVLRAARDAGIRMVLLQAYYHSGGFGKELSGGQLRFGCADPVTYWRQIDLLMGHIARQPKTPVPAQVGAVVHSIRAAPVDHLAAIHQESRRRRMVFHMHVEEQPLEISECEAALGAPPMEIISRNLELDEGFTAVHCTHTSPDQLKLLVQKGANVCICPLTEANLGDGLCDLAATDASLCLGSDSNLRISMVEEMRWLEYGQRLKRELRGSLRDERGVVSTVLLRAATSGGARSLGLKAGRIEPGHFADFVALNLDHPQLAFCDQHTLPDAFVFGSGSEAIADVCVGGRWCHPRDHWLH